MKIKTISRTSEDYARKSKLDITKVLHMLIIYFQLLTNYMVSGTSKQRSRLASV
jgi:hypothetical protein